MLLDETSFPPGYWNTLRLWSRGPKQEVWFNGRLLLKHVGGGLLERWNPQHTSLTRTAGRIALQHWGPERVEFRNIRVRKLPP